jgi:hypothetical protein
MRDMRRDRGAQIVTALLVLAIGGTSRAQTTNISTNLRIGTLILCVALCTLGLGLSASAQPIITTFDPPGSNSTYPLSINLEGAIVGNYYDASGVSHGFLRSPSGKLTTFDAPGAGTNANINNGTFPKGINLLGTIGGWTNDANDVSHGFLRTPDGTFTTFDAPGSDTNPADQRGTTVTGINDLGATSGYYQDVSGVFHGFLRSPNGEFTTFEAPKKAFFIPVGTLNLEGSIVGYYLDSNYLYHAFVRTSDGKFKTFVGPGSCDTGDNVSPCYGNGAYNINLSGTSVGAYMDNSGNYVPHEFLRSPDGKITTFEPPGAGTGFYQGTFWNQIAGLNDWGAVTATYLDANNVYHGFLRSPDGKFTTFDAPGADTAPCQGNIYACHGTIPVSINDLGAITGFYIDSNYVYHGFLRIP